MLTYRREEWDDHEALKLDNSRSRILYFPIIKKTNNKRGEFE